MKKFCFTVDDNIRFLRDLSRNSYKSIFDHPYLAVYKRLHEEFGLKVQLNLFNHMDGFDVSEMSEKYYSEWADNADWLKLSFHSDFENYNPYVSSEYDEVFADTRKSNENIVRFASPAALAKTTTIHFCEATADGIRAISDNGYVGLLGLFGTENAPRTSYEISEDDTIRLRLGEVVKREEMNYAAIDIVLNGYKKESILAQLEALTHRDVVRVMIHEQYFYPDYEYYQPDFEEKLRATFAFLKKNGFESRFFEEIL